MFRGFYTVATGMIAQQRRTELLTNNISNANTPGFKEDQSSIRSFPDMLLSSINAKRIPTEKGLIHNMAQPIGTVNTGIYMQDVLANYEQGQLRESDFSTDFALVDGNLPRNAEGVQGAILFRLQHESGQGEAYTRNGNFTVDGQGYLTNPQGLYVLSDTGQRIRVNSDDFRLADDGMIYNANNQQIARLGVSYAANPTALTKQDNGLFRAEANLPSAYNANGVTFAVQQNFLEGSNVDGARSMTELMTAYRAFEANQKILQAYDRSMEKAVNEIGKV